MLGLLVAMVVVQGIAAGVLLARLMPGRRRKAPIAPVLDGAGGPSVSVIVPTLNEAGRVRSCLEGLMRQGPEMTEVLVVDSRSTDGTREIVADVARRDPRIALLSDDPLPAGWVGRVWALECGSRVARGEWVLGVDADTVPERGMIGGVVRAATEQCYDAVSFAPRFAGQSPAERWLQPALLTTLVYRGGVPGADTPTGRLMANGQCFLARRETLRATGGYANARASWADDVTLARALRARGARVGFLDGSRLFTVRSYASAREMWREWGRSIDLADTTTKVRQWLDVAFLALVQGIPVLVVAVALGVFAGGGVSARTAGGMRAALTGLFVGLNVILISVRVLLLRALAPSYEVTGRLFWLSPLADPLAVLRIALSTVRRPTRWRGREYSIA